MIKESNAIKYCKDDILKIENYEKAINDTDQMWDCHHRLELTLDGEFAHSAKELQRLGMYYHRPYFELIFLTHAEHQRIHHTGKNNPLYGKNHSEEAKAKISASMTGKQRSTETRLKISNAKKGKKITPFTSEHRQKLSEAKNVCSERYRQYKSNGGTLSWNEFQSSFKATESEI